MDLQGGDAIAQAHRRLGDRWSGIGNKVGRGYARRGLWNNRRTVVDRNSPHSFLHVHAMPRIFAGVHFDDDTCHCLDVNWGAYSWIVKPVLDPRKF